MNEPGSGHDDLQDEEGRDPLLGRLREFRIEFFLWVLGFVGVALIIKNGFFDPKVDNKTMFFGGFFAGYIPLSIAADYLSKFGGRR